MGRTGECAGIRLQLGVYLTGAIAPADRAALVRHLASCQRCRDELAGLAALRPGSSLPWLAAAGTVLETEGTGRVTVLANAEGFTLYWFAPDTAARPDCTASCARHWPPVTGPATAGAGVTGAVGQITRTDGSIQATYDGHPLYTASLDTAPGQARGNGVNASGGPWHEVTVPDAAAPASSTPRHVIANRDH